MSPFEYLYQVCGVEEIVVPSKATTSATKSGAAIAAASAFEPEARASSERTEADTVLSASGADVEEGQGSILRLGADSQTAKIVFVSTVSRAEYQANYQTMFEKMVAAMGLDLSKVQLVLEGEEPWPESQTKVRINLGSTNAPIGWSVDKGDAQTDVPANSLRHLVVPSFIEMAKDPEFKKIAWQYLKTIKA